MDRNKERARLEAAYGTDAAMGVTQENGVAKLPDGTDAVICTNIALYIFSKEENCKVMFFTADSNPSAEVSKVADGHDFAIVNGFIVDPWVSQVESLSNKSIFDTESREDAAEIRRIYGPKSRWDGFPAVPRRLPLI